MPESARIERYGPEETLKLKDSMISIYLAGHVDRGEKSWYGAEQYWHRLTQLYAPSRDFSMVAAWKNGVMVGFAFGSPKDNSATLWEMTGHALTDVALPDRPEPIYFFREFSVHPEHQGHGYGRLLHDSLLRGRPEPLAHLLVRQDNPVKDIYQHWGWRIVGQIRPFENSPVMDAMIIRLPIE